MAFLKLDCGILTSTIWCDREAREIFITALLMAEPYELREPMPQLEVRSLKETGFIVPVGWYGFIAAAGSGIIRMAGLGLEEGLSALERLGSEDKESRTPDHGGRRLVRVSGGYIALNYDNYRKKDHTAAERSKRYRLRKQTEDKPSRVALVTSRVASQQNHSTITQAEAEAEVHSEEEESIYHKDSRSVLHVLSRSVLHVLNEASGFKFREVDSNLSFISQRLREPGVSFDGVRQMIHRQVKLWKGTEMEQYLRPATLFNKTKFDGYYSMREAPTTPTKSANQKFDPSAQSVDHYLNAIEKL